MTMIRDTASVNLHNSNVSFARRYDVKLDSVLALLIKYIGMPLLPVLWGCSLSQPKECPPLHIRKIQTTYLFSARQMLLAKIRTHAHNLANANTAAFKRCRINFTEAIHGSSPNINIKDSICGKSARIFQSVDVIVDSTDRIFDQGTLQYTGRNLDVAVEGPGFLRVTLPDGTSGFTRGGSLIIDSEGNIMTQEGNLIDPLITLPQDTVQVLIDQFGLVQIIRSTAVDVPKVAVQIGIAIFINPSGLKSIGNNLYSETVRSGVRVDGNPGQGKIFGFVRQGYLEKSNVNENAELLEFQRTLMLLEKYDETDLPQDIPIPNSRDTILNSERGK